MNTALPLTKDLVGTEVEQDVFTYTLSDGQVHTTPGPVVSENLITQSEAFNLAPWTPFGTAPTITANADVGPLGGAATADEVTLGPINSGIYYVTTVPGIYTFSVWVRLISGDGDFSFNYYSAGPNVSFLQSAVATSTWQRMSFTFDGDLFPNSNVAILHTASQSATGVFEFFGAQLNPGTTATPYVPTSGSAATATSLPTTPATFGSTLSIAVAGSDAGKSAPALNLQSDQQGVVINLATDQWSDALTVMPFGDSITHGWTANDWVTQGLTTDQGYRGPLWQSFVSAGALINFVGDQTDGPSTLLSQANAGYPGETTAQMLARLPYLLAEEQPQAILLMGGTNDVTQGIPTATTIANLTAMLNMIDAANPDTHVYLSEITPLEYVSGAPALNAAIDSLVQSASAMGQNVSLVSQNNFPSGDVIYDGIHPTDAGYAVMAQNFYNAMLDQQPLAGGTPGGTVATISPGTLNAVGGAGNDLLIGNSGNNILTGGPGNDVFIGGGGTDTFIGGGGANEFDIKPVAGAITVADFLPQNGDFLAWDHITGLTSLATLNTHVTVVAGSDVVNLSSFGVNLTVTLTGYTGNLNNSSFLTS